MPHGSEASEPLPEEPELTGAGTRRDQPGAGRGSPLLRGAAPEAEGHQAVPAAAALTWLALWNCFFSPATDILPPRPAPPGAGARSRRRLRAGPGGSRQVRAARPGPAPRCVTPRGWTRRQPPRRPHWPPRVLMQMTQATAPSHWPLAEAYTNRSPRSPRPRRGVARRSPGARGARPAGREAPAAGGRQARTPNPTPTLTPA